MNPKLAAKFSTFPLVLALVLAAVAGPAPLPVQAQGGSPTPVAPLTAPQIDPATGSVTGMEPAAPLATAARYPGTAAYDSGWRVINPQQTLLLTHSLGGSLDDYVVDLRFSSHHPTMESHGYNQIAYGGNQLIAPAPTGYAVDDRVGAYWHSLNTTSIKVFRQAEDKNYASWIRLRIWVVADEDYDSGWQGVPTDTTLTLGHNLGGAADNYLVDLQFKDTGAALGVHQRFYGGFSQATTNDRVGAYWRNLTNTLIQVYRRADEAYVDEVRVRIWSQPRPTYDSGWVNGSLGSYVYLTHAIGGNPDDYIVDLQFKDTDDGMGVNQRCYGGCDLRAADAPYASTKQGAYWRNLTRDYIEVGRRADDHFADQVRVRIWNVWTPTRPDYDSGWKTTDPNVAHSLSHGLGDSADDYLVNLVYWDTGWKANQWYYGLKYLGAHPPTGYSADETAGAYWRSLTDSSVVVYRAVDDNTVDQWRLRIWRMPKPDYDSGWYTLAADTLHAFDHGLVGDPADFLVDVSFNDVTAGGSGMNQRNFGGGVTSANEYRGAHWYAFTTSAASQHLTVYRYANDINADQVRVRIWRVSRPDYQSGYLTYTAGWGRSLTHGLGVPPENMLVDVTAHQATGDHKVFYGRVDIGSGSTFPTYAENDRAGFYWYNLTPSAIAVNRAEEDDNAVSINVRIWALPFMAYLPIVSR